MEEFKKYKFGDIVNILDSKRIPLSATQRENRKGIYPYYGAQGIIDYIDDYIFDGTYLLIAEDGENLKSQKNNIAQIGLIITLILLRVTGVVILDIFAIY